MKHKCLDGPQGKNEGPAFLGSQATLGGDFPFLSISFPSVQLDNSSCQARAAEGPGSVISTIPS